METAHSSYTTPPIVFKLVISTSLLKPHKLTKWRFLNFASQGCEVKGSRPKAHKLGPAIGPPAKRSDPTQADEAV